MLDRVTSIAAYRHTTTDNDKVNPKVKVKDKVTKQHDQNKSSAGAQSTVQLRSVFYF